MRIDIITLFPDMFQALTQYGVSGRALQKGLWELHCWNPRDYTYDLHRTVDDRPYGGGPGMVMLAEPLERTLLAIREQHQTQGRAPAPFYYLSPVGQVFKQSCAQALSNCQGFILLCGRYEGVDQRFLDRYVDGYFSLGDFVLSGGEVAAMAMIDSVVRLLPGALNTAESVLQDSFHLSHGGLLDSPHYTRPEVFAGQTVPPVLLSGHHAHIAQWRRQQSLRLTAQHRPDILRKARAMGALQKADERFLREEVGMEEGS